MKRFTNKTYCLTVEGFCEQYYFEHLAELINADPNRKHNCIFKPKIAVNKRPLDAAKQSVSKDLQYYHIQDIEDGNDKEQVKKFHDLIANIKEANEIVDYKLGYTNFTFDLWIVLHKINLINQVPDRNSYLTYINRAYHTSFTKMDEYKREDNFKSILNSINLIDIRAALDRADKIRQSNIDGTCLAANQKSINYKNYCYFRENPDLDIQYIVQKIIKDCLG